MHQESNPSKRHATTPRAQTILKSSQAKTKHQKCDRVETPSTNLASTLRASFSKPPVCPSILLRTRSNSPAVRHLIDTSRINSHDGLCITDRYAHISWSSTEIMVKSHSAVKGSTHGWATKPKAQQTSAAR